MRPRVTVIGSCRVYTPFKMLEDDGRVELRNQGVYGYTHYAKEAVQQLEVMKGALRIPVSLARYITHKRLPPGAEDAQWVSTARNDLSETDLLVVEVSSLKEIDFRGYYLQINRLREQLIGENPALKDWWRAIYDRGAQIDRTKYRQSTPNGTDRAIVELTNVAVQEQDSLFEDMARIADYHDGPTLFVSHFNTTTFGGDRIPIRDRLAGYVEEGAKALGHQFFNPRELVEAFGLELALQDLAHYTPPFERALAEYFYARLSPIGALVTSTQ